MDTRERSMMEAINLCDARGPEMLIYLVAVTIAGAIVVFGAIDMLSSRRGYGSVER